MRFTTGQEALIAAVLDDNLSTVLSLLKEGHHPDFLYGDSTPLQEACRHGNFKIVKALVEAGANVNRRSHHALADFPLDIADSLGDTEIIRYLEDKGATSSVEARIHSVQRQLFDAVVENDEKKVAALLKSGLDPDFTVEGEVTPLDEAISRRNIVIVRALVSAGADVNRVNAQKDAPLDIALQADEEEITRYLKSEGSASGKPDADSRGQQAKPVLREDTLADIFAARNWVGKTKEMEDLWQKVPKRLKRDFDFAASLAEARQQTLRKHAKKIGFQPRPNPPAP